MTETPIHGQHRRPYQTPTYDQYRRPHDSQYGYYDRRRQPINNYDYGYDIETPIDTYQGMNKYETLSSVQDVPIMADGRLAADDCFPAPGKYEDCSCQPHANSGRQSGRPFCNMPGQACVCRQKNGHLIMRFG